MDDRSADWRLLTNRPMQAPRLDWYEKQGERERATSILCYGLDIKHKYRSFRSINAKLSIAVINKDCELFYIILPFEDRSSAGRITSESY